MLRLFGYLMMAGFLSLTWAAKPAATAKKAPVKKSAAKSTARKAPAKSGTRRASTSRATSTRKTASWRSRQAAPTPDRYKQIQEALAAKGYLKAEDATGQWNSDSVDALKRFQADQKIAGAGKINSLSLIALGLGPKRENLAAAKPPVPPQ